MSIISTLFYFWTKFLALFLRHRPRRSSKEFQINPLLEFIERDLERGDADKMKVNTDNNLTVTAKTPQGSPPGKAFEFPARDHLITPSKSLFPFSASFLKSSDFVRVEDLSCNISPSDTPVVLPQISSPNRGHHRTGRASGIVWYNDPTNGFSLASRITIDLNQFLDSNQSTSPTKDAVAIVRKILSLDDSATDNVRDLFKRQSKWPSETSLQSFKSWDQRKDDSQSISRPLSYSPKHISHYTIPAHSTPVTVNSYILPAVPSIDSIPIESSDSHRFSYVSDCGYESRSLYTPSISESNWPSLDNMIACLELSYAADFASWTNLQNIPENKIMSYSANTANAKQAGVGVDNILHPLDEEKFGSTRDSILNFYICE